MPSQFSHSKTRTSLLFLLLFVLFAGFVGVLVLMSRGTDSRSQAAAELEYYFSIDPIAETSVVQPTHGPVDALKPSPMLDRGGENPAGPGTTQGPEPARSSIPSNQPRYALNFNGWNRKGSPFSVYNFIFDFALPVSVQKEVAQHESVPANVDPRAIPQGCSIVQVGHVRCLQNVTPECMLGPGAAYNCPKNPFPVIVRFTQDAFGRPVIEVWRGSSNMLMEVALDGSGPLHVKDAQLTADGMIYVQGTNENKTGKPLTGQINVGTISVNEQQNPDVKGYTPTINVDEVMGVLPGSTNLVDLAKLFGTPKATPSPKVISTATPKPDLCRSDVDCHNGQQCDQYGECVTPHVGPVNNACTTNNQCSNGTFCFQGYCVVPSSLVAHPLSCNVWQQQQSWMGRYPVTDRGSVYPSDTALSTVLSQIGMTCVNNVEVDSAQKPIYLYDRCGFNGAGFLPGQPTQQIIYQQQYNSALQQGFRVLRYCSNKNNAG